MSRIGRRADGRPLERAVSVALGTVAGLAGLRWRGPIGTALAAAGGYLVYRGLRGRRLFGGSGSDLGHTVEACNQITIQRPLDEVRDFLSDPVNLMRFSRIIERVEPVGHDSWHCEASTPWGSTVGWLMSRASPAGQDERTAPDNGNTIAWCTTEDAPLPGAVLIRLNEGRNGTELHADAWFVPPAAEVVAPVLRRAENWRPLRRAGLTPSQRLQQELRLLRQLLEAGEVATISGQSSGRRDPSDHEERPSEHRVARPLARTGAKTPARERRE